MDEKTNQESEIIQKNKRKTPEIIGPALIQIKKLEEKRSRIAKDKEEDSDDNL